VVKEPLEVRSWVVCDGDVDPEWIESLNSVLDDNRLLTLPNGERIQFAGNVNFLFESDNLKYASPATVSRMGMIFMSEEDIDVKAVVASWLVRQPAELQLQLGEWIERFFYRALDYVIAQGKDKFVVETTLVGLVKNGLSHLTGIRHRNEFMLGIARGFGGNMLSDRRNALAREIFGWFGEMPADRQRPLDCLVDPTSGALVPLKLPSLDIAVSDLVLEPMIPTIETASATELIMPCLRSGEPMILVGPEGCGKSMLLRALFASLKSTAVATLHCSSQTTATHVIQKLNQACSIQSSTSGRVYRPKDTERLILHLKDVNLPKPDKYETMQLISFLQ
jgi:dynein heavy chain 2